MRTVQKPRAIDSKGAAFDKDNKTKFLKHEQMRNLIKAEYNLKFAHFQAMAKRTQGKSKSIIDAGIIQSILAGSGSYRLSCLFHLHHCENSFIDSAGTIFDLFPVCQ